MYAPRQDYAECQDCGAVLRELSLAEQQKVADNPYNFIFYCNTCIRDIEKSLYETEPHLQKEDTPVVQF